MAHYLQKATEEDILLVMAELEGPFMWTMEIAEAAGYKSRYAVRDKLLVLADRGLVEYRRERSYIWWISADGWAYLEDEHGIATDDVERPWLDQADQ